MKIPVKILSFTFFSLVFVIVVGAFFFTMPKQIHNVVKADIGPLCVQQYAKDIEQSCLTYLNSTPVIDSQYYAEMCAHYGQSNFYYAMNNCNSDCTSTYGGEVEACNTFCNNMYGLLDSAAYGEGSITREYFALIDGPTYPTKEDAGAAVGLTCEPNLPCYNYCTTVHGNPAADCYLFCSIAPYTYDDTRGENITSSCNYACLERSYDAVVCTDICNSNTYRNNITNPVVTPDKTAYEILTPGTATITGYVETSDALTALTINIDTESYNCDYWEELTNYYTFSCDSNYHDVAGNTYIYTITATQNGDLQGTSSDISVTTVTPPVGPVITNYNYPTKSYSLTSFTFYGGAKDNQGDVIDRVEIQDALGVPVGTCAAKDGTFDTSEEEFTCTINNPAIGENTVYIVGYDANDFASEYPYEYLFTVTDPSTVTDPLEAWDFDSTWNNERYNYVALFNAYQGTPIDGYTNGAISFNGNYYTYYDPNGSLSFEGASSTFYVEGFVKKDDFTGGGNKRVIGKMSEDGTENTWAMGVDNDGGVYCSVFTGGIERSVTSSSNSQYLTPAEWNRIGCEWNGSTGTLTAYLMDTEVAVANFVSTEIPASSNEIAINARAYHPAGESEQALDLFDGSIDRIRVFKDRATYTAYAPAIDIFTNGHTPNKAYRNPFVVRVFFNGEPDRFTRKVETDLDNSGNWTNNCVRNGGFYDCTFPDLSIGTHTIGILGTSADNVTESLTISVDIVDASVETPILHLPMEMLQDERDTTGFYLPEIYRYGYYHSNGYFNGDTPPVIPEGYLDNAIGILNNTYYLVLPDDFNKMYSFDSINTGFKVEAYVKKDTFATPGENKVVGYLAPNVTDLQDNVDGNTWLMGIDDNGGVSCSITLSNGQVKSVSTGTLEDPVTLVNGQWNKIGCNWSPETGNLSALIGDQVIATLNLPENQRDIMDSANALIIGGKHNTFNGYIDELKISYVPSNLVDTSAPAITVQGSTSFLSGRNAVLHGEVSDISSVSSVTYSIDGGEFVTCSSDDGTFNENSELFTCDLGTPSDGNHTVRFNAVDNANPQHTYSNNYPEQVISVVNTNLLAHFAFENNINNEYGFLTQGTIQGSIAYVTGSTGNGISVYNGSRVEVSDPSGIVNFAGSNAEFAVETYIRADDFTGGYKRVAGKMNNDSTENAWLIGTDVGGGLYCGIWTTNDPGSQQSFDTYSIGETLTPSEWNKIGCSWNANTRTLKGYINGKMVRSVTYGEGAAIVSSDKNFIIGAQTNGNQSFTGYIDEVKIYNDSTALDPIALPDIFTFDNQYKVVSTDKTTMTGSATYEEAISSIQYREYINGQNDTTGWMDCTCTDGTCDSTQESFSCDVDSPYPFERKVYEMRVGSGNPASYISSDRYQTFELLKNKDSKLAGWWTFDSSTSLSERSGTGNNGTYNVDATLGKSAITGSKSVDLATGAIATIQDTSSSYDLVTSGDQSSVSLWVKPSDVPDTNPDQYYYLAYKRNQNGDGNSWEISMRGDYRIYAAVFANGNVFKEVGWNGTNNYLTLNQWNHVVFTFNNLTKKMTIKVNNNTAEEFINDVQYSLQSSNNDIKISGNQNGEHTFYGEIDDLQIWKTSNPIYEIPTFTLDNSSYIANQSTHTVSGLAYWETPITSIQIRPAMNGQAENDGWDHCTCTDGTCNENYEQFACYLFDLNTIQNYPYELRLGSGDPVTYMTSDLFHKFDITRADSNQLAAWWTFDSTENLRDSSANNLDGYTVGTVTTGNSSTTNSSVNIFSENGYFVIPDSDKLLNFSGTTSEFTIEALVRPSVDLNTDWVYTIMQKSANNDDMIWDLSIIGGRNTVRSRIMTSERQIGLDTTQTLNLGEWNKITLSFSNLDQTYTVKINDNAPEICTWYKAFDMPQSIGNVTIGADRGGGLRFLGEIDDIKILNTADARAPQVSIQPLANPERVTNANQPFSVTVTDETGIADFEYLFYDGPAGSNLDGENWVKVANPTSGSWGDKSIAISITAPNLGDGEWYMYMRSTDTNGYKHLYTNDGWYSFDDRVSPSAMPYYRFVMETEDNTPPHIFAQSIVPNPTVDRNPGVRGYVKDYMTEGVGDTPSNIASIEYRLTQDDVVGEWIPVPPLNGLNSPFEEFYFQFENLVPANYDLEIRASDASGNSTEDNNTNHKESFIIYQPDVLPQTSIINKEEDFNTHQYHDVLFSDGVWGNGILRLRQTIDFSQQTALFTNNSDFGFKFGVAVTGTYASTDGNLWVVTNDYSIIFYNTSNGSYVKYPAPRPGIPIVGLKEFQYSNKRYLMIYGEYGNSLLIRDINNTPMNPNDDTTADYGTKTGFSDFQSFDPFTIDTRNGKFAYYANTGTANTSGEGAKFFIWVDTKGTIMNVEDDTYVTWGTSDNLFFKGINPNPDGPVWGYQETNDFTGAFFDTANNTLVAGSYSWGIYECNDGGTPEDKSDDVCRRHMYPNNTYHIFMIFKDPNGYYWLSGDDNLARVDSKGTNDIFDDTYQEVLSHEQIGYEDISQMQWVPGEYPVGDEIWMITRSGHIKALEFNYTYDDVLDDTQYEYRIRNIDNRAGGMSTFTMTDRNTIYVSLQGYGLQKISLTRGFENTNVIEMLPIPPDGILAINYIDLEEVLGYVTPGSSHTFNELVSYEVSNDSGLTWYPITQGQRVEFPTPDYKLKLRIILNRGSSPIIDLIKLSYVTYPNQDISEQCDIKITEKAPAITSIQPMGTNSMKIKFTGVQDEPEIQKYVLEYGLSSTVFQYAPINLAPSATSYTLSGLSLNTNYYFRLRAVTDCSQSAWSNVLSAKHTGQPVQPPIEPPTIPDTNDKLCGETCTIDTDCTDQNNVCIEGKCQLDANSCAIDEKLNENKCACTEDTSTGGMCGQVCSVDAQCTEANNKCIGGLCKLTVCPSGYMLNDISCGCVTNTGDTNNPEDEKTTGIVESVSDTVTKAVESAVKMISSIPVSVQTAETATNITMITVVTASLASAAFGASYPMSFVLQGVAYALGVMRLRKKSRDYGVVYDAVTKEPLNRVIVRIFDINNKLVDTEVTDVYGVFETHIKENGQYKIQVMARNYDYPSKVVIGDTDGTYEHIYRGGMFVYDTNTPIDFSIPVDPYNKDVPEYSKAIFMSRISTIIANLQNILIIFGLVFSIVTYVKNPSTFNLLILIAYLIFMIINVAIYLQGRHKYGIVKDLMLAPKAGVAIGLRELEFEKIKSQRVTDDNGKYRFIVPGGKYRVEVLDPNYEIVQDTNLTVDSKSKGVMVINKNIRVRNRAL